jgi:hypothetical protein
MSNRYARILAAGGAAVLVAALGRSAALAATTTMTWTVRPGGATTATAGMLTYANQTGKLKILAHGGTLHWYHVNDCAGLIHNDDTAALSATFTVSPEQDITSP